MAKGTKSVQKAGDVEVLPAQSEDVALITEVGGAIREFVKGVAEFFRTAASLEQRSKATEMGANALTLPHDAGSDEVLQRFAKRVQAEKKEVEAHWEITTLVHGLHRRLTGRRKVAIDALDRAAERANNLHNRYVEDERRRVAAEDDRKRREAEAAERKRIADEAAELERKAIDAETASADLSEREQRYVALVVDGVTPYAAAKQVGFKEPDGASKRLLGLPKITKAIEAALTARQLRQQAEAVKQQPVEVEVERTRPDVTKGIATDRTTWSAELLDERALINAAIAGQVPTDILQVNPVKLNEHARALQENINRWPGVRAKKSTRMV